MRRMVPLALGILWVLGGTPAAAKPCGDDVAGKRVACACGDVVVSSLTLGDDPVVSTTCDGDGLVVRVPEAAEGVTIDLKGRTLRGGERGAGLWIIDGGPGGAKVVSSSGRGRIEGFRDGIVARGARAVALVENVDVRRPGRDGLRLHGGGYRVLSVTVEGAGRDGLALDGRDFVCRSSRAAGNGRFGFNVNGRNSVLGLPGAGNTAEENGRDGFHLMGSGHRLNVCEALRNRKEGVSMRGGGQEIVGCIARGNGTDGIAVEGGDIALFLNRAEGNARNGIKVSGVRLLDGGGNRGADNRGEGQQRPAIQCDIGGNPCVQ